MGQDYSEVVERLQAYRQAECKTQKEMSADLGVTQSHYAKLESGANIISYDCLETFEKNGGDIHFLITGQRQEPGEMDVYMDQCQTAEGKLQMFRFILWIVKLGMCLDGQKNRELPEAVYKNLRLAQSELDEPGNVWKRIRSLDHITQFQMADILGINIKRYIRLENKITKPDAEILYRLYSRLSYGPLMIMRPSGFCLKECNDAWDDLHQEVRDRLNPVLALAAELVGDSERG